jgi:hypothetical protein
MYHLKEGSYMTTHSRFDFSLFAIVTLLVLQAGIASYGLGVVRDVAGLTHARFAAVADASR